jgi:hypothetical protein
MSTRINTVIVAAVLTLFAAPQLASAQEFGNYAAAAGEAAAAQSVIQVPSDARASVGKVHHSHARSSVAHRG